MYRDLENKIMKKKNITHLHCICHYCGGITRPIGQAYDTQTMNGTLKDVRKVIKYGCKSCGNIIEKYIEI